MQEATLNGHGAIDLVTLKSQAANRWPDILGHVGGLPADCLDGKHHPCPKCGGTDRFRLIDAEAGAVLCTHCCTNCGDGIAAVQWSLGVPFKEAIQQIGGYLGMTPSHGSHRIDDEEFMRRVCLSKRMPVTAAKVYGAKIEHRGANRVVRFPMYGPDLQQCSTFDIGDDGGKGRSAKGQPVGLFLPHDALGVPFIPKVCTLVEGVKDAAAAFAIGNPAVGLPTSTLNEKFAHLFTDVEVIAIPDLDSASFEGFEKTRRRLDGIASSFATVRLPGEMGSKNDLRDVLAKPNGETQAKQAIAGGKLATTLPDFPRFTLSELTQKYQHLSPPVIHGLIREGETANFIANPKVGKSWAMYGLAINVATGTDWLGIFPVSQGRVLLIDNELHPQTLAFRIPAVGDAMGLPFDEYRDQIDTWCLRGNLRSLQELLIQFRKLVKRGDYKLLVFDAKYRFSALGVSENDNAAETAVYNLLDQIADETGAAVVVVHHMSKGGQSDKRVTDVGAGAGAQSRAADCHLILREHEDDDVLVLDGAVRSFPPVAPVALRWSFPVFRPDEYADAGKLKGRLPANEERQSAKDKEGRDAIVKALLDGPLTVNDICRKAGMGKQRFNRLIGLLEETDQVTTTTVKIAHNDAIQYQLNDPDLEGGPSSWTTRPDHQTA